MAEEDAIKRVMPHSIEAEQSVIGAMLMDAEAIEVAMEMLREEDFYARQYGVLFAAIVEMHQKGMAVDPVTLQTRLREKNLPPEVYGSSTILELIEQVPTSANIKSYAQIVSEKSLLRKMIRANEEIAGACYTQKDDMDVIMNQAEKKIFEISQRR
ncbi:MAG: replicative DNA helicase, partial [Lachnospiraceae bacterium]|nr:replicative DNA helicase [Lachnospiraceae bacterium]